MNEKIEKMPCRPGADKELKVHDFILGIVFLVSCLGSFYIQELAYIGTVIGVLMVLSFFTGFCPLHYILQTLGVGQDKKD